MIGSESRGGHECRNDDGDHGEVHASLPDGRATRERDGFAR